MTLPRASRRGWLIGLTMMAPVIAVSAVLLAPGVSSGKSATTNKSASAASAAHRSIVVIGGAADDPFFSTVKNGVDSAAAAAKAAGWKLTYLALANYDNIGPDTAKLDQTALSLHPTAIVSPDFTPTAQNAALTKIVKAGVTLVLYNSGSTAAAKAVGALTYIGADYYDSGVVGGKKFLSAGIKHVMFVNTVPGDPEAQATSSGYKAAMKHGGTYTELDLPSTSFGSPTAVTQAVKSELSTHPSIDGVATYGAQDSDSVAAAIQSLNKTSKVKLIGFNLSTNTEQRIKAGTQLGAIDQQPYAEGFYAVAAAFQYAAYGIRLPVTILTGPALVDSSNVAAAITGTKEGMR